MNKIYGIDWHNTKENEILTCSQDKLVKVIEFFSLYFNLLELK